MAIIRNDRSNRRAAEPAEETVAEEEEIDYSWHPSEDEFTSPITAEQWAELLGDEDFCETDAAKAVRCLYDYGEPATFQQLSIRYRGTMGRYRRWLSDAAKAAGERYGVEAPQKDQFGMDEWWPLLYRSRATGKPGANVFEMQLRPEVEDAYELIVEQEKQAKRAENARQLQRIEQLERARREEREKRAAKAAEAAAAQAQAEAEAKAQAQAKVQAQVEIQARAATQAEQEGQPSVMETLFSESKGASGRDGNVVSGLAPDMDYTFGAPASNRPKEAQEEQGNVETSFPRLNEFLSTMGADEAKGGFRFVSGDATTAQIPFDITGPVDYALRYADRLRNVIALMREGNPGVTAAAVAREAGDKSVEHLQSVLNGQKIPDFEYLDALRNRLFVNHEYLEAIDGTESSVPAFCTYQELGELQSVPADLSGTEVPCQIAYVVDDSPNRRTGVILRFSALRCALLTRHPVNAEATRGENQQLNAFVRMVDELDSFARSARISRTSHQISAESWDKLASGAIWPGSLL